MKWHKVETGRRYDPYRYVTINANVAVWLQPPYPHGKYPWAVTLSVNSETVMDETFCLRNDNPLTMEVYESEEDLEKAKVKAFEIVEAYIEKQLKYWNTVQIREIIIREHNEA